MAAIVGVVVAIVGVVVPIVGAGLVMVGAVVVMVGAVVATVGGVVGVAVVVVDAVVAAVFAVVFDPAVFVAPFELLEQPVPTNAMTTAAPSIHLESCDLMSCLLEFFARPTTRDRWTIGRDRRRAWSASLPSFAPAGETVMARAE